VLLHISLCPSNPAMDPSHVAFCYTRINIINIF
jgi:hypothetical protein